LSIPGFTCYFAYGSNLHLERMRARIASAQPVETAVLSHHILKFNKRGRDGSGKCSVAEYAGHHVAGVVYRIRSGHLSRLDRIEGTGYRRRLVLVRGLQTERAYKAHCYLARPVAVDDDCVAYDWYRDLVVTGAEYHGLPPAYIERLKQFPVRVDPNSHRHRQQLAASRPRARAPKQERAPVT
jgi:hypothetical protein